MTADPGEPPGGRLESGARGDSVRRHNLSVVLRRIVNSAQPVARTDVVQSTGLAKGTVSALVDALLEARLVVELDPVETSRAGRPAVPLAPAPGTLAAVGVDIAADGVGVRAVDLAGNLLAQSVVEADLRGVGSSRVFDLVQSALDDVALVVDAGRCRIVGAGVAVPGVVDRMSGMVRRSNELVWDELEIASAIGAHRSLRGRTVRVGNDVRLAARAELVPRFAAITPVGSFCLVAGRGEIAAAVVLGGAVVDGAHGWAGRLGHVQVDPSGPACRCGRRGCLAVYADLDQIWQASGLRGEPDLDALVSSAERRHRGAERALQHAGYVMGVALADLVVVLDLEEVVLGGSYARLAPWIGDPLARSLRQEIHGSHWADVAIRTSKAGPGAAMTGAALVAFDDVLADPAAWTEELALPAS